MKTSDRGLKAITLHEGMMLKRYQDVAGFWTIGVGHLIKEGENLYSITEEEAMELLKKDVSIAEGCVLKNVTVTLLQHEFDALVSFVFNIGCGAFVKSTLLRKLNNGDKEGAAAEFGRWNKAGGKEIKGITTRREKEMVLFISGVYPDHGTNK